MSCLLKRKQETFIFISAGVFWKPKNNQSSHTHVVIQPKYPIKFEAKWWRSICYIWSHLMNLHTFLQSRVTALPNPIAFICLALISYVCIYSQPFPSHLSEGYTWFRWGPWWLAQTCCSHTCCPPPPWRDYCWGSAESQRTCQSQHGQPDRKKKEKKKERWKRKREQETVESEIWQAVKEHGYDVNFHVCHRICVMSVHILPWQRGEGLWRDSTGCMSRVWSISPPAVNKHTETQTDSHQRTHIYSLHTYFSNSLHPPLFLVLFLSFS